MATASNHYSRVISEELLCPVCLEELKEPKFLACAHNICKECLEMVGRNGREVRCPVCRRSIDIPEGGVSCIPTNAVLVRLIEATPGRKERLEIQLSLERAKPVVRTMTIKISDLDKVLTDLTVNVDKVEKEIHDKADQLVEAIRKQETSLCSEVEEFYGRKQDMINKQKSTLFKLHSNALNSVNLAEAILKQNDAIEIGEITTALVQQLDEVSLLNLEEPADTSTYDERLVFSMNTEATCEKILENKKFGKVSKNFLKAQSRPSSTVSSIDWSQSGQVLHKLGHKGSKKGSFKGPAGVSTNEFEEIAVSDFFNNRIQVFDSRLKFQFEFGKKGIDNGQFQGPTGVVYTSYNNIIVFDSKNSRVQIFNRNGEFVSKFGQQGSGPGDFGQSGTLSVDKSGDIIVTDSDNNRVQVFSNNGVFKFQFGGRGTEGFDNPLDTIAIDNEYFTTDSGNYCIKVFNAEGQYVRQFGRQGAGAGAFQCPRGLAVDYINELILVCDSENHSVHILKPDGSCLGKFPTKKIPVALAIFQKYYLLVCSYHSNRVQLISYA
ncbi:tripartite motif-containing protein 2-like [Actinia tenebrosa]|uniref:Tripartite motif-containing protein 2-like n=1 Tax=Actinia tenebrosa TaxID=6105 RepID=A0A6P8IZE9_ACTTE|nr:tripartite motif-containing protein 2-like [Actinia tenebrosa]